MDQIDTEILRLLRQNARLPLSDIARSVSLSAAPVARRIARMEADGLIRGYTAIVEPTASGLTAFTEVRLNGSTETGQLVEVLRGIREVVQSFTISGDPDLLIKLQVRDVHHLQEVVNGLRRTGLVAGTKTLIVMDEWDRALEQQ
ncbi:Lrp/AsnC family transcriptional regulator [Nocardioides sp. Bht2]|uniref:Lrp/AsnC family transcriptional regulator n=1 Tax=Nocardioides sp. Bht2 TaxID=3392297 RepID=UPI0039B6DD16